MVQVIPNAPGTSPWQTPNFAQTLQGVSSVGEGVASGAENMMKMQQFLMKLKALKEQQARMQMTVGDIFGPKPGAMGAPPATPGMLPPGVQGPQPMPAMGPSERPPSAAPEPLQPFNQMKLGDLGALQEGIGQTGMGHLLSPMGAGNMGVVYASPDGSRVSMTPEPDLIPVPVPMSRIGTMLQNQGMEKGRNERFSTGETGKSARQGVSIGSRREEAVAKAELTGQKAIDETKTAMTKFEQSFQNYESMRKRGSAGVPLVSSIQTKVATKAPFGGYLFPEHKAMIEMQKATIGTYKKAIGQSGVLSDMDTENMLKGLVIYPDDAPAVAAFKHRTFMELGQIITTQEKDALKAYAAKLGYGQAANGGGAYKHIIVNPKTGERRGSNDGENWEAL